MPQKASSVRWTRLTGFGNSACIVCFGTGMAIGEIFVKKISNPMIGLLSMMKGCSALTIYQKGIASDMKKKSGS